MDKISTASWSRDRGTVNAVVWEQGRRASDDDRLSPKLWLTTVALGWASHKNLRGGNRHSAGVVAGGAEPGTQVLACTLSHGLRGWRTGPGTSQVSISHWLRADTDTCLAGLEGRVTEWRKRFLAWKILEGLSLRMMKAPMLEVKALEVTWQGGVDSDHFPEEIRVSEQRRQRTEECNCPSWSAND